MSTQQSILIGAASAPRPGIPYQGLMPFSDADAEYFFGREQETRLIISNLRAYSTTVLFGPSGVGKSSILQAGVIRTLAQEQEEALARFGGRESVTCYVARWHDSPLPTLAAAIRESLAKAGTAMPEPDDDADRFEFDAPAIIRQCANADVDLFLILDQFEEYFYYHSADVESDPLAEALARLVEPGTRVNVLFCLREDALAALDRFEMALPGVLNNSLRLEHLDADACRAAIQGPLDVYNSRMGRSESRWEVDTALVERLLVELRAGRVRVGGSQSSDREVDDPVQDRGAVGERVEAPYLQLVLSRLWVEEEAAGSRMLRESTLELLGGSQAVVEDHLDTVLQHLDAQDLDVVAKAFSYLVTPSGTKIAHKAGDLASWTGVSPERMRRLLDELASGAWRIMRQVPPPVDDPSGEPRFEIFHDVLAVAVLDWTVRHDAALREEQLVAERDRAAREASQTRKRLVVARSVIAAMVALLLVCGSLGWWAWNNKTHAETNELLALSRQQASTDPNAALGSAIQAWQKNRTSATEEALRTAVSANHQRLTLQVGPPGTRVILSEFIEDGQQILTVSSDGHLRVWSASNAELLVDRDFAVELDGEPSTAAVLADGSGAVIGGFNGIVVRVPFDSDEPIVPAVVGSGYVSVLSGGTAERSVFVAHSQDSPPHVFVDPDYVGRPVGAPTTTTGLDPAGTLLATWASDTREMALVDLSSDATRGTTSLDEFWIPFIDINASGVVAAAGEASLFLWDGVTDSESREAQLQTAHAVNALAFSEDGTEVVLAGDKRPEIIDVATTEWLQLAPEFEDWVTASELSPDETMVVAAGRDGMVSVFPDGTIGRSYLDLAGHSGAVTDVAFNPGGNEIVTGAEDGTARVWRLPETTGLDIDSWTLEAQPTSDGSHVAAVTSDHFVIVVDANTGELIWWNRVSWFSTTEQASDVAWDPDGSRLVVTATDAVTPYLVAEDVAEPIALDAFDDLTYRTAWSPVADHIAASGLTGSVGLWDADTGDLIWQTSLAPDAPNYTHAVNGLAFTAAGDVVAAAADGTIRILGREDGATLREIKQSKGKIFNAAMSSDGRYLGTVADDWQLRVWDLDGGSDAPFLEKPAHHGTVSGIAFGGGGSQTRVATSGADGTVHVYDVSTGDLLAVLDVHTEGVNSVAFDPVDPDRIIAASDDGTVSMTRCDLCSISDDELLEYAMSRQARSS